MMAASREELHRIGPDDRLELVMECYEDELVFEGIVEEVSLDTSDSDDDEDSADLDRFALTLGQVSMHFSGDETLDEDCLTDDQLQLVAPVGDEGICEWLPLLWGRDPPVEISGGVFGLADLRVLDGDQ